jgi:hypothetical protein
VSSITVFYGDSVCGDRGERLLMAGKRPTPDDRPDRLGGATDVEVFYRDGEEGLGRLRTVFSARPAD